MIAAKIGRALDGWMGRGDGAITSPLLDGPLKPNSRLDATPSMHQLPECGNAASGGGDLFVAGGDALWISRRGAPLVRRETFGSEITALAVSPAGAIAVGLDGGGVVMRGGPFEGRSIASISGEPLTSPTAIGFLTDTMLAVANGSTVHRASEWKRDLMSLGRSGWIGLFDLATGDERILARNLAFPMGIAVAGADRILVTEAWRHAVVAIDAAREGKKVPVATDLPGYPARLVVDARGDHWLSFIAIRNQLVEFVLREPTYRHAMMKGIDPAFWIAPTLRSEGNALEPLQGGAVRQMGQTKPWAPGMSYGLVVRFDKDFIPLESWHSRADGVRHGITSIVEHGDDVLVVSRGAGEVLALGRKLAQEDRRS